MTILVDNKPSLKIPTYTSIRNILKNALAENDNTFLSRLYLQGFTVQQNEFEAIITNSRTGASHIAYMIEGDLIIKNGKKTHTSCKYTLNRSFALKDFLKSEKAVVVSSEKYTIKMAVVSSGCVLSADSVENVGLNGTLALNNLITVSTVAVYGSVEHFFIDDTKAHKAKGVTAVRKTLVNVILNNGGAYKHQKVSNRRKTETLTESLIRKAMNKGYKNICSK